MRDDSTAPDRPSGQRQGLKDRDKAARLRRMADELDGGRGRPDRDQPRTDGGTATAHSQVPARQESDVLTRVWPLSPRLTALAGVGLLGWAGLAASTTSVPLAIGGLAFIGGSVELARSQGRQEVGA